MLRSLLASVQLQELPDADLTQILVHRCPGVQPLQRPALISLRLAQLLASSGSSAPGG